MMELASLPACVRVYLQEKDDLEAAYIEDDAKLNGQLRGMQMQDYVNAVRTNLHNEHKRRKKYIEAQQKMKSTKTSSGRPESGL